MEKAVKLRNGIPFYYNKTQTEFRQDPYERFDPMVIRQSVIHLADQHWGNYSMQPILDYIFHNVENVQLNDVLEIGCGVGRMIGELASNNLATKCWGIDFSYQMLKRAKEVWIDGKSIKVDASTYGYDSELSISSKKIANLKLGLAKCESLPFNDSSQDVVFSSFLFDRLEDPLVGLKEMKRVVRKHGKIIIVSPLNFKSSKNWNTYYPLEKLQKEILKNGFKILDWSENIIVKEPLDVRDNVIYWNNLGIVLR